MIFTLGQQIKQKIIKLCAFTYKIHCKIAYCLKKTRVQKLNKLCTSMFTYSFELKILLLKYYLRYNSFGKIAVSVVVYPV